MEPDVPLLVPEINFDHLKALEAQRKGRGWKGQIVTNPNCSTIVMTLGLAPLKPFGIKRIVATTLQAISGAGYPGVASMDINANVIPFIGGEEPKMESETQKIMGEYADGAFQPLPAPVSAHCNRVPVVDGHMVCVSVELASKPSLGELQKAYVNYTSVPQQRKLPSAPERPVIYMEQENRPQPRRDVERENGMAVFVGRLRECPVMGYKFIACGHNTVRGAAGAAVLNAELMHSEGLLG
jgi:aspartate-semialdehyde dehydrogenase